MSTVPTYGPYLVNGPGTQWAMLNRWYGEFTMLGQAAWKDTNTGKFYQKVEVETRDGRRVNILFQLPFDVSRPDYSGPLPGQVRPYFPTQDQFTYGPFAGSPPPGGPMMAQTGAVAGVGLDYSTLYSPVIPPSTPGMTFSPSGQVVHPAGCGCATGQAITNPAKKLGPYATGSVGQGVGLLRTWFKNGYSIKAVARTSANGREYDIITLVANRTPYQVWFDVTSYAWRSAAPGSYT